MSLGTAGCVAEYEPNHVYRGEAASALSEYDPFADEDLPALLLDAQVRQSAGKLLSVDMQRELYEYGLAETHDPRPWLLLARDSMAREWAGFAIRQYGLALRADARVADTTNVLRDVLFVATHYTGVEERDASALLSEYWGITPMKMGDVSSVVAEPTSP